MKERSVQALLDWLESKGLLIHRPQAEAFVLCQKNIEHAPVYIHILLGFGALLGCCFAVSLLKVSGLIDWSNKMSMITYGAIFIGLAIMLQFVLRHTEELLYSFSLQLSCISMLIGKVLFITGITYQLHTFLPTISESWIVTLSIGAVVLPTYFLFPVGLDRFLSISALLAALLANMLFEFNHNIAFFAYYVGLLGLVGFLINYKSKSYELETFTYASITALGLCSVFLCFSDLVAMTHVKNIQVPWVIFNLALAVAMIAQILAIVNIPKPLNHLTLIGSCLGVIILGIISSNGILFGIALLIVGYGKHRLPLVIAGFLFLAFFVILYYYNLSLNLAQKAAILAGSGGLLLIVRMALQHEKWDKPS